MYALLVLDIQVGLVHGPETPWRCDAMLDTVNGLMDQARRAGAGVFLARHVGPAGSPMADCSGRSPTPRQGGGRAAAAS